MTNPNRLPSFPEPTSEAIEKAGGLKALSNHFPGYDKQHVYKWRKNGRIPEEHVLKVEEVTGVSRHRLRPDIFGTEDA